MSESGQTKFNCGKCIATDHEKMVQCDFCDLWYHFECVGVGDDVAEVSWRCDSCVDIRPHEQAHEGANSDVNHSTASSIENSSTTSTPIVSLSKGDGTKAKYNKSKNVHTLKSSKTPHGQLLPNHAVGSFDQYGDDNNNQQHVANINSAQHGSNVPNLQHASNLFGQSYLSNTFGQQHASNLIEQQHVANMQHSVCAENMQHSASADNSRHSANQINYQRVTSGDNQQQCLNASKQHQQQQNNSLYSQQPTCVFSSRVQPSNNSNAEYHHIANNISNWTFSTEGPSPAQLAARQVLPRELPQFNGDPGNGQFS